MRIIVSGNSFSFKSMDIKKHRYVCEGQNKRIAYPRSANMNIRLLRLHQIGSDERQLNTNN